MIDWVRVRLGAMGVLIAFVVLATVYNSFRVIVTYRLSQEMIALHRQEEIARVRNAERIQMTIDRLDEVERVLFGDVVTELRKPSLSSRIELWQKNRDKELRDRLQRLETWRQQQQQLQSK